jgi:hypothetical protein
MDYLTSAIQNLSPKETVLLQQKIKNQKVKQQLLQIIQHNPDIDNKDLGTQLNYHDNLTNLYTLKNRLLDDIISSKIELSKNEVIRVKEKIQNIRLLVYSKDRYSLIRELKKLEKTCLQLELFNELKEVYFCFFLTYRHENKRSKIYLKIMESVEQKQLLSNKLEEIFYSTVLDCQDLFYLPNRHAYEKIQLQMTKIRDIHEQLNNKTSSFFYLSGELTLKLSAHYNPIYNEEIAKQLAQLFKTYNHSFLIYKYPGCDVAIQCLYSRFYYLIKDEPKFNQMHKDIFEKITRVKGYQMFDCSYYYYVYVTVLNYIEKEQYDRMIHFIEEMITEDYVGLVSARLRNHYLYLLAIKEYYSGNFSKASSLLLKSRSYFTYLDSLSCWVGIENILLNILIYITTADYKLLDSEMNLLKRMIRQYRFQEEYDPLLSGFFRIVRQVETGAKQASHVIAEMEKLRAALGIFRLVHPQAIAVEH